MQIVDRYKEEAFKTDLTLRNFYNPLDPLYRRSTRLRNKDINLKIPIKYYYSSPFPFIQLDLLPSLGSPNRLDRLSIHRFSN